MGQDVVRPSFSSFSQLDIQNVKFPPICSQTNFTKIIGQELYLLFQSIAQNRTNLTADTFNLAFPFFKNETAIQKSLFRAIDADGGNNISFDEFIKVLSIMSLGSTEERTQRKNTSSNIVALKIIDLDGDQKIQKKELLEICTKVQKVLKENVPQQSGQNSTIPPEEIVDRIFNQFQQDEASVRAHEQFVQTDLNSDENTKESLKDRLDYIKEKIHKAKEKGVLKEHWLEKKEEISGKIDKLIGREQSNEEISYEEFAKRAEKEPEFLNCFGLFTLFYYTVVLPIEKRCDTNKYRLGYPTIEGSLLAKGLIGSTDTPYVQVLNGFMNFYQTYRHCVMHDLRWNLEDKEYVSHRTFPLDSEMAQSVHRLLDGITQERGVSIGLHNFTKSDELNAPAFKLFYGNVVKHPDTRIFVNCYGTAASAQSLLAGTTGLMSYRIGDTGKKIVISFEVPLTSLSSAHFNVGIYDEWDELSLSMFMGMNNTAISKGDLNIKKKDYHIRGVVGDPSSGKYTLKKFSLRFELYECVEYPPPLFTLDLTESVVSRGQNNSFWVNTPLFDRREFHLEKQSSVLDAWISVIQANRKVCDVHDHQFQSFSPMRNPSACRFYIAGKEYYDDLLKHLKSARTEILITGWFISPQVHLSRTKVNGKYVDRLDEILLEKARQGLHIYILVWDEIDAAFNLGSKTVYEFIGKHENVHIVRDPLDMFGLWSHHQKTVIIDQMYGFCGGIDLAYNRYETLDFPMMDEENDQIFPGRDYVNPMVAPTGLGNIGSPYEDVWKRSEQPRMPWQDIQCKLVGEAARDLARNFIQRWNRSRGSGTAISLRASDYNDVQSDDYKDLSLAIKNEPYQNCKVQIIRSACYWSMGLTTIENSIYQSQIDAIRNAKHFIYIENQFFVSSHYSSQINPQNKILKAIIERVSRAIENKEPFRFIFVTPVHSSSPMKNLTVQQLTFWQLATMFHGEKSLFGGLKKKFPDVDIESYITISCLRQWGKFKSGIHCTEMLYVHSKLMIVDDKIAFISSANVNDRSMMGDRDSEIGARIEDNDEIEITMAGQPWKASKFAFDLRHRLQCLWCGAKPGSELAEELKDPVLFYDKWLQISRTNRDIFVDVFQKTEDVIKYVFDVHYLTEFGHYLKARNVEKLQHLQGRVVPYPENLFGSDFVPPNEIDPTSTFYC